MKLGFDGPLGRKIVALAAPTVGAMISQTLINNADHILVGRIDGPDSVAGQAALGPALAMLWMVGGSLSAITVGTQALTARRIGEQDNLGAGKVLANSVSISVVLGFLASILFVGLAPMIFPVLSKDPDVQRVGIPFLQWRYAGVMAMAVTASYKSFFDAIGQTKVHFVVAVAMNVINALLNIGLIFGKFGLPKMGVEGSGLASCISSYIGCFMIIAWSMRARVRATYQPYRWSNLLPSLRKEIARLSAPSSLAVIVSLVGFAVFYWVCGRLDSDAGNEQSIFLAATGNIINIFMLVFISCMAYGTATATLVGQGLGAGDHDLAERSAIEAAKIGFVVFAGIGLLTALFPGAILHIWSKDADVINVAEPILRVLGGFEPFVCVALVFIYALYGAGDSRFVMIVELTLHFACLIPLSYLLGLTFGFGMWGIWGAMIAYVVLMAVIMTWKFRLGHWKTIRI
ncbi:MAG: MATE family efflux transporter [Myxococcales bacterium]|nr:MATE family efflux transporter [Myxococcales bacterium]